MANALVQKGIKVVGVPKTIDNDLSGTDACFGFDTAVSIATEAVDRLHSTAEAHNRVIVCEVMGRDAGWIAITSGIAEGADVIFVPEKPIDIDQAVKILKDRHDPGSFSPSWWWPRVRNPAQTRRLPRERSWMPSVMLASAALARQSRN